MVLNWHFLNLNSDEFTKKESIRANIGLRLDPELYRQGLISTPSISSCPVLSGIPYP
jgi:hypothetical protein